MGNRHSHFQSSYSAVHSEDGNIEDGTKERRAFHGAFPTYYMLAVTILTFPLGVMVGNLNSYSNNANLIGGYGEVAMSWHLNETFVSNPNPASEAAWQSIIPDGRGFVTHPRLAPEPLPTRKSLTRKHHVTIVQHALQVAYYSLKHDIARLEDPGYSDPFLERLGAHVDVEHVQHCFDYLRQALMCAADTNLEVVDPVHKTTDGWGFERTCRDYWAVVRWAEEWKNNDDHTILASEKDVGNK